MRTGKDCICELCGKSFYVPKNRVESGKNKYCSRKCYEVSRLGRPMHPNTKKALLKVIPWNKGLKASEDERVMKNITAAHEGYRKKKPIPWNKGLLFGKSNWIRLNGTHQYRNLHKRIQRRFGKPEKCSECGIKKNAVWANISGEYREEREDWKSLCQGCHMKLDYKYYAKDVL